VSVPGGVATGSGGTLETERDFLIRSLPLPVLTRTVLPKGEGAYAKVALTMRAD
jgi:hypothetical protein